MSDLPPLVALDDELLERHRAAHGVLAETIADADSVVRRTFLHLAQRLLIEGLANVQPVFDEVARPVLLPAPRRFLTEVSCQRMAGAAAALRYVDSALTMTTMPAGRPVIQPTAPCALNALLAGPVTERETNAGLVRASPTNWKPDANSFEHPPAEVVGELLDAAIAVAADESRPAVERAGWLAFVTMTIHPFVDGNGRTARALFLATIGSDVPGNIDWGVLDQLHVARQQYIRALQQGQQAERYRGDDVDAGPFVRMAAIASARGAEIGVARLQLLSDAMSAVPELADPVVMRVAVDRFVSIRDVLDDTPVAERALALRHIDGLVQDGLLEVTHAGAGAPAEQRGARGVTIAEGLVDAVRPLRRARYDGD